MRDSSQFRRVTGAVAATALVFLAFAPIARGQSTHRGTHTHSAYCRGSSGGSVLLSDRSRVVYAVHFVGDSAGRDSLRLDAVFVTRYQPGWVGEGWNQRPAAVPTFAAHLTGASVDTLFLGLDRGTDVAWVHMRKVPLHGANLILVDRVDGVGGPPTVVALGHLPSAVALPFNPCTATSRSRAVRSALRDAVLHSEQVRAFIAP